MLAPKFKPGTEDTAPESTLDNDATKCVGDIFLTLFKSPLNVNVLLAVSVLLFAIVSVPLTVCEIVRPLIVVAVAAPRVRV